MSIKIKIRDFRGIERADLDVAPIALVAGRNGSGKTSLCQAVAAVITGNTVPIRGITKSAAGVMVRASRETGWAMVTGAAGKAQVEWPACTRRTAEQPPEASIYAAGLASVADADVDRVRVLSEYLHATPTRDDLVVALADYPRLAGAEMAQAVWELIERRGGWDAAHAERREKGAELKGRWRQITGENFGSQKAASYRVDLETETRSTEQLIADVETAREAFEHAIATSAVSGENRARLEAAAATVEASTTAVTEAENALAAAALDLETATAERAACEPADGGGEMPCPHCGGMLILRRTNLVETVLEAAPTKRIPENELKERRLAIAGADGKVARCRDEVALRRRKRDDLRNALVSAMTARSTLEASPVSEHAADAESARTALGDAERRLAEVRTKRQADEMRDRIADNETLLGLLAPDGLRARKLARVVEAFNTARLGPLCGAAGWRAVTIDPDLELAYGGRHYALLSASEQFRVRVVLQVAMAQIDGAAMVVIDGADILDAPARSELVAMLATAAMPAIVTMTLPRAPADLAASGLGRSYWLDAGELVPVAERKAAA